MKQGQGHEGAQSNMQRRTFVGLCGAGLAGLIQMPSLTWAATDKVKVGLTATIMPGMTDVLLAAASRPFRSLLESATGLTGEVMQAGDARGLADKLKQDKVQL